MSLLFCFVCLCVHQGSQRGETLCDGPLAQHRAEEEGHGSTSQDTARPLRLPPWSKALLSSRMSTLEKHVAPSKKTSQELLEF